MINRIATAAYIAKRELIDLLTDIAADSAGRLAGVQVKYALRGDLTTKCIYGGGITFDQPEDDEVVEGRTRTVKEAATLGLHIRVARSPATEDGIREADLECERIATVVAEEIDTASSGAYRISSGQGDYSPNDDSDISTLSLRITVDSWVTTERQLP